MFGGESKFKFGDNPNHDAQVVVAPRDTISSLRWSGAGPFANLLSASSWSGEVRIWDVAPNTGQSIPKFILSHAAPVLCCDWQHSSPSIISGACDDKLRQWTLTDGQPIETLIGEHAAPIKSVHWNKTINCAISGSWDKTIAMFDPRTSGTRVGGVDVSDRIHCMDNRDFLVAVGTSDRVVTLFDLRDLASPVRQYKVPIFQRQSTAIRIFPDKRAFALSSIEGRVHIQYLTESDNEHSFKFKCHRLQEYDAYAVNALDVTDAHDAFVTAGSEGSYAFWNRDRKQRLAQFHCMPQPITSAAFNHSGTILAYATGYDWSKGIHHSNEQNSNHIFLHHILQQEIT